MARGWYGLYVGDKVDFMGKQGIVTELFVGDKNRGIMQFCESPHDTVEIVCEWCKVIEHQYTLEEIDAMVAEATKNGEFQKYTSWDGFCSVTDRMNGKVPSHYVAQEVADNAVDFIAAAPMIVRQLVARVRELEGK